MSFFIEKKIKCTVSIDVHANEVGARLHYVVNFMPA